MEKLSLQKPLLTRPQTNAKVGPPFAYFERYSWLYFKKIIKSEHENKSAVDEALKNIIHSLIHSVLSRI